MAEKAIAITIRNGGTEAVDISLEPEGDVFPLQPKVEYSLVFRADSSLIDVGKIGLEMVLDGGLLSLYSDVQMEVWSNGKKLWESWPPYVPATNDGGSKAE